MSEDRDTVRTARCCCGGLKVVASAEPKFVLACHCVECQRRTGSVFGVSAYFRKADISLSGPSKMYIRDGQDGRKLRIHFCPDCGTSVYWELDILPGHYGVAVGTFADSGFPAPIQSLWEQDRHPWLGFEHNPSRMARQPGSEGVK
jgi:hypothetical protein